PQTLNHIVVTPEDWIQRGVKLGHIATNKPVNVVMRRPLQPAVGHQLPLGGGLATPKQNEISLAENVVNGGSTNHRRAGDAALSSYTSCVEEWVSGAPERCRDARTCCPVPVGQGKVVIARELPA